MLEIFWTIIFLFSIYMIQKLLTKGKPKQNKEKKNSKFETVKSNIILGKIFQNLNKKSKLEIIKYNKRLVQRLNININDFKECSENYSSSEIVIIPAKNKFGKFINIFNENEKIYYHIFFDNDRQEIDRNYITRDDKVEKIKIIIDYQVKSFKELFFKCDCIESINFKKLSKKITSSSYMFYFCSSLKEVNFSNCNLKVVDMNGMFCDCSSLKKINLSNFDISDFTNMKMMFCSCSSLENIDLSNFNTDSVNNMSSMFNNCSKLEELNLSNFNTNQVTDMSYMFYHCLSLKKLNISSFAVCNLTKLNNMFNNCSSLKDLNVTNIDFNNIDNIKGTFYGCPNKLKNIIKKKYKNINEKAFQKN